MGQRFRALCALSCLVYSSAFVFAVSISPVSATVQENANQQFTASTPSTWITTCGSVSTAGLFVIQELTNAVGGTATGRNVGMPCFASPSAWKQNVYFIGNGDVLKQFTLDPSTGMLSATPAHQGAFAYGWPGSQSMVSSNGDDSGIIWTFDNVGKTLRADDAGDVSQSLYVSPAINTGYLKWTTPTVINGHVYIGGNQTVVAFGVK